MRPRARAVLRLTVDEASNQRVPELEGPLEQLDDHTSQTRTRSGRCGFSAKRVGRVPGRSESVSWRCCCGSGGNRRAARAGLNPALA